PLAIAQQESRFGVAIDENLCARSASALDIGIPPAFVDRPRPCPPAQRPITVGRLKPHRVRGEHSPVGYSHRITLGVKEFHRTVDKHTWRRLRQLTGPRLSRVGPWNEFVAKRHQRDPLARPAATGQHRNLDRLWTQKALHPYQRPSCPQTVFLAYPAPQRQLQRFGRDDLDRLQTKQRHRCGWPV